MSPRHPPRVFIRKHLGVRGRNVKIHPVAVEGAAAAEIEQAGPFFLWNHAKLYRGLQGFSR
jgi:uncharacterized Fe-S center protein